MRELRKGSVATPHDSRNYLRKRMEVRCNPRAFAGIHCTPRYSPKRWRSILKPILHIDSQFGTFLVFFDRFRPRKTSYSVPDEYELNAEDDPSYLDQSP